MEVMRTALSSLFSRSRKRKREEMEDDVEEGTLPSTPLLDSDAAASALTPPALPPPPPPPPASAGRDHETKRVLLEQLSCPVCLCSPLLPPARQCPNGHLLCDACSKQPACAKCPTCRSSPTNIRCLALEKVAGAEGITAPCPHCEAEVPFSEYSEHTASCALRPTLCLKSSLSAFSRGPATRARLRRSGQHEAPDIVLSPMRPVAIGRSSASSTRRLDVRIHHSEVSRRHCEVGLDPTGAWIVDRSSNGTYLNGERIPRAVEVRLQHGDRITFLDRINVESLPTYTVEAHAHRLDSGAASDDASEVASLLVDSPAAHAVDDDDDDALADGAAGAL